MSPVSPRPRARRWATRAPSSPVRPAPPRPRRKPWKRRASASAAPPARRPGWPAKRSAAPDPLPWAPPAHAPEPMPWASPARAPEPMPWASPARAPEPMPWASPARAPEPTARGRPPQARRRPGAPPGHQRPALPGLGLVSASAQAPGRARSPNPGKPGSPGEGAGAAGGGAPPPAPPGGYRRPLAVTGAIAASAVAGTGVALLTTLTAIGWITAPHAGLGNGLPGVLRTAITLWLAAHHVAFTLHGAGQIGMLPLGLLLIPGALLWRAGRWVVRSAAVARLRYVGYVALALALPYALLSAALALAARSSLAAPSLTQAVIGPFLTAL